MWRRIYCFGLLMAAVAAAPGSARELHVERLGPEQGLAHNAVTAILEDSEGFIWLGTQDGLQRYDGVEFETYRADGSAHDLSHSNITALFETPDRSLWIGTVAGLNVLSPDRRALTQVPSSLPGESVAVSRIAPTPAGEVTISTRSQGLLIVDSSGGELVLRPMLDEPAALFDHGWTPEGDLMVLGYLDDQFALLRLDADGGTIDRTDLPATSSTPLAETASFGGARLTLALLDHGYFSDGRNWLWRSSLLAEGEGVLIGSYFGLHVQLNAEPRAQKVELVGIEPGLADEVLALARDRSGTLWIGTYGGLLRADPARKAFFRLPRDGDEPPGAISSIVLAQTGQSLLLGTFGAGVLEVSLPDGDVLRRISPAELSRGACSDYVWSTLEVGQGLLVVVTSTAACSFSRSGNLVAIVRRGDYRHMDLDDNGGLWISGSEGLLHLAADGVSATDFALLGETIRSVSPEELWLGPLVHPRTPPEAIIARLNPVTRAVRHYSLSRQTSVFDLMPLGDGNVLVATSDGLLSLDARTGSVTELLAAADTGTIYSVQPGEGELTWLGTSRGIVRVDLGQDPLAATIYAVEDGVTNHEFNRRSRLRTDDGRILLGGMDGITAFDPGDIEPNPYEPPIRLKKVDIEGRGGRRSVELNAMARLGPDDFAIDFEFASLSSTRADRNRYRYRIRSVDHGWVEAGTRRSARYAGLPPGDYSFEVLGSNNDGVWSREPAVVDFAVLPPFHQTWWARLLGLLLVAAVLAWFYRLRRRRFLEMERMRLRIASDLHDELGSELSGIALASNLVGRSESLEDEERRRLTDVAASSRRVMEGLRDIVWYVNPEHDRFDSLIDRMRDTARRLSGEARVEFTADPASRAPHLDMQARRQLFLVYKELLTNALRHSGGTEIRARLTRDGGNLELTVTDDGVGFDPSTTSNGSGLSSVRRRAQRLGGDFNIRPREHGGSSATLRFPLT